MTRREKYPDTETFCFYNANPHNRFTTDCVIRAISAATDIPYNQVVMELAKLQCKTGYDDGESKLYGKYLESKGWIKCKQPRKTDNTKYTGKEFCKIVPFGKKYIAHIGGHHVIAIINGQVWDTWDCTEGCIGNYWTK